MILIHLTKLRRLLPTNIYLFLRQIFSKSILLLPFRLRCIIFSYTSSHVVPYKLVNNTDVILQFGMPLDLLMQGRSRSLLFYHKRPSFMCIVEPDPRSYKFGVDVYNKLNSTKTKIVHGAVHDKLDEICLLINNEHQATNRVIPDGFSTKDDQKIDNYTTLERVTANTILFYVEKMQCIPSVISITTNGNELIVLEQYLSVSKVQDHPRMICLAPPDQSALRLDRYNYKFLCLDDRGMTFIKE